MVYEVELLLAIVSYAFDPPSELIRESRETRESKINSFFFLGVT